MNADEPEDPQRQGLRERLETILITTEKATSWHEEAGHLRALVNHEGYVPIRTRLAIEDLEFLAGGAYGVAQVLGARAEVARPPPAARRGGHHERRGTSDPALQELHVALALPDVSGDVGVVRPGGRRRPLTDPHAKNLADQGLSAVSGMISSHQFFPATVAV
ncbi:hypothetical protein [Nonomuraea salmonea]|uniref:hypothetical protein n=1 Tax=Nonomuraea salmonea TaxID=46181 RepID=UPI002FE863BB